MNNIESWCAFLKYATDRDKRELLDKITSKKEGVKMAMSILSEISKDEKARIRYENELFAELDYNTGIYNAKKEKTYEIALKLINLRVDKEAIAEATGLSLEVIESLS